MRMIELEHIAAPCQAGVVPLLHGLTVILNCGDRLGGGTGVACSRSPNKRKTMREGDDATQDTRCCPTRSKPMARAYAAEVPF